MNTVALRKVVSFGIVGIFLLILQTIPNSPILFLGIRPNLLLPMTIAIAVYGEEKTSAIFGLALGFLWDVTAARGVGYHSIILMLVGYFVAIAFQIYLRRSVVTFSLINLGVLFVNGILFFFLFYLFWDPYETVWLLVLKTLPGIFYSFVLSIPFYFISKLIYEKVIAEETEE